MDGIKILKKLNIFITGCLELKKQFDPKIFKELCIGTLQDISHIIQEPEGQKIILEFLTTVHEITPLDSVLLDQMLNTGLSQLELFTDLASLATQSSGAICCLMEALLESLNAVAATSPSAKVFVITRFSGYCSKLITKDELHFQLKFEVLKSTNTLLEHCPTAVKERLMKDETVTSKLKSMATLLLSIGDYEFQVGLIECLFRIIPRKHRQKWAETLFKEDSVRTNFLQIKDSDFEADCRIFLKELNDSLGKEARVFSIPCLRAYLGNTELLKPSDPGYTEFWVDFNLGSERLSLFCEQKLTASQSISQDDELWETVIAKKEDICSYTFLDNGREKQIKLFYKTPVANMFPTIVGATGKELSIVLKSISPVLKPLYSIFGPSESMQTKYKVSCPADEVHIKFTRENTVPSSQEYVDSHDDTDSRSICSSTQIHAPVHQKKISVPLKPMFTPARLCMQLPHSHARMDTVPTVANISKPLTSPASTKANTTSPASIQSHTSPASTVTCNSERNRTCQKISEPKQSPLHINAGIENTAFKFKENVFQVPKTPVSGKLHPRVKVKTPVVTLTPSKKQLKQPVHEKRQSTSDTSKVKLDKGEVDVIPDSLPPVEQVSDGEEECKSKHNDVKSKRRQSKRKNDRVEKNTADQKTNAIVCTDSKDKSSTSSSVDDIIIQYTDVTDTFSPRNKNDKRHSLTVPDIGRSKKEGCCRSKIDESVSEMTKLEKIENKSLPSVVTRSDVLMPHSQDSDFQCFKKQQRSKRATRKNKTTFIENNDSSERESHKTKRGNRNVNTRSKIKVPDTNIMPGENALKEDSLEIVDSSCMLKNKNDASSIKNTMSCSFSNLNEKTVPNNFGFELVESQSDEDMQRKTLVTKETKVNLGEQNKKYSKQEMSPNSNVCNHDSTNNKHRKQELFSRSNTSNLRVIDVADVDEANNNVYNFTDTDSISAVNEVTVEQPQNNTLHSNQKHSTHSRKIDDSHIQDMNLNNFCFETRTKKCNKSRINKICSKDNFATSDKTADNNQNRRNSKKNMDKSVVVQKEPCSNLFEHNPVSKSKKKPEELGHTHFGFSDSETEAISGMRNKAVVQSSQHSVLVYMSFSQTNDVDSKDPYDFEAECDRASAASERIVHHKKQSTISYAKKQGTATSGYYSKQVKARTKQNTMSKMTCGQTSEIKERTSYKKKRKEKQCQKQTMVSKLENLKHMTMDDSFQWSDSDDKVDKVDLLNPSRTKLAIAKQTVDGDEKQRLLPVSRSENISEDEQKINYLKEASPRHISMDENIISNFSRICQNIVNNSSLSQKSQYDTDSENDRSTDIEVDRSTQTPCKKSEGKVEKAAKTPNMDFVKSDFQFGRSRRREKKCLDISIVKTPKTPRSVISSIKTRSEISSIVCSMLGKKDAGDIEDETENDVNLGLNEDEAGNEITTKLSRSTFTSGIPPSSHCLSPPQLDKSNELSWIAKRTAKKKPQKTYPGKAHGKNKTSRAEMKMIDHASDDLETKEERNGRHTSLYEEPTPLPWSKNTREKSKKYSQHQISDLRMTDVDKDIEQDGFEGRNNYVEHEERKGRHSSFYETPTSLPQSRGRSKKHSRHQISDLRITNVDEDIGPDGFQTDQSDKCLEEIINASSKLMVSRQDGFISGPSTSIRPSKSAFKRKYGIWRKYNCRICFQRTTRLSSEIQVLIQTEQETTIYKDFKKDTALVLSSAVQRNLVSALQQLISDSDVSEELEKSGESDVSPKLKPRKLFKTGYNMNSPDLLCAMPLNDPTSDKETDETSTNTCMTMDCAAELTLETGVSTVIRAFGVDIQNQMKARQKQLESLSKSLIDSTQKEVKKTWNEEYQQRQSITTVFQDNIIQELGELEKEMNGLKDAEDNTLTFFKEQQKLLEKYRYLQKKRLRHMRSLKASFAQDMNEADKQGYSKQHILKERIRTEIANLRRKLLIDSQKQELVNVRKCLQTLI